MSTPTTLGTTHSDYHPCGSDQPQLNGSHDGYWAAVEAREARERFAEWQPPVEPLSPKSP